MYTTFVGIDISKLTFDVCILDPKLNKPEFLKLNMSSDDFSVLELKLSAFNKESVLTVMESTGPYHYTLMSFLLNCGYKVCVVNPYLINNYIKSDTLRKTKNDKKDAQAIANFACKSWERLKPITAESIDSLRVIFRERESLTQDSAKLQTEIKQALSYLFPELVEAVNVFTQSNLEVIKIFPSAKSVAKLRLKKIEKELNKVAPNKSRISADLLLELATKSIGVEAKYTEFTLVSKADRLSFILKEINRFDRLIEEEINKNNNDDFNILTSVDGIGNITSKTFIAEIGDINKYESAKQLIAYIGTDPSVKQSGSSINISGKISKRGNSHLRRNIWLMAVCVIRENHVFNAYFQKKRKEGMKYKKAVIATANKLLRVIFSLLKNRTLFEYPVTARTL